MASNHEFKAYPQHNKDGSALKGYLVWVRVRPDHAMPVQGRTLAHIRYPLRALPSLLCCGYALNS